MTFVFDLEAAYSKCNILGTEKVDVEAFSPNFSSKIINNLCNNNDQTCYIRKVLQWPGRNINGMSTLLRTYNTRILYS